MKAELKALVRSIVFRFPSARRKYNRRAFLSRAPSCTGPFRSFAEALADVPTKKLVGFDHEGVAEQFQIKTQLNDRDYPVLFWLSRIVPHVKQVFELGGSAGEAFYIYDRYLSFAPDLRWTVCDLPALVRAGRQMAQQRQEVRLRFTENREDAAGAELYATFGALQYLEEPFAEILGRLPAKPRYLLISRVPFTEGKPFVALQNNGNYFAPYKLDNRVSFLDSLYALGYEMVEKWEMTHPNSFLLSDGYQAPGYHGFYLRLK